MAKIEVNPEMNKALKQFAEEHGSTVDEAAEHVLTVGINRLSALRRYGKRVAKGEVGGPAAKKAAPKKTAKKPAKKTPAKKAPKAKKAPTEAPAEATVQ